MDNKDGLSTLFTVPTNNPAGSPSIGAASVLQVQPVHPVQLMSAQQGQPVHGNPEQRTYHAADTVIPGVISLSGLHKKEDMLAWNVGKTYPYPGFFLSIVRHMLTPRWNGSCRRQREPIVHD